MHRWLIIVCIFASLTAAAQTRAGLRVGGFRNGAGFAGQRFGRVFGGRGLAWSGDPFFYSDYSLPAYEPPASPVVIVQPTSVAAPADPKREPLMIEWHGDRYVRLSADHESVQASSLDYSEAYSSPSRANIQSYSAQRTSPSVLSPAILIFRDGHHESVSDYVIANGNLYARGDYWRDGFWTKTVQLSTLDIPATLRANSEGGVKFVLPSGPNEVVTRP